MSWWAAEAALRSESRKAIAWSSGELVLAELLGSTRRADDLAGRVASIYISNLSPQQLHTAFDDRIASRLLCGTLHELDGNDRRFQQ